MDIKEEVITEAFLARAAPGVVYEWLKAWPQVISDGLFWWNDIPRSIQQTLLARDDEIIDLALAAWGTDSVTLARVYRRRCSKSVQSARSTLDYAVLVSILGNVRCAGLLFGTTIRAHEDWPFSALPEGKHDRVRGPLEADPKGLAGAEFDWLIEHGDDDLLSTLHKNIGPAPGLLRMVSAREGAYGRIDDNRWFTTLALIGHNARLRRVSQTDSEDPDLDHWDIHQRLVNAAAVAPKTTEAADVLWGIFIDMPTKATEGAYVSDELLSVALAAWLDVVSSSGDSLVGDLSRFDGMTHSERVRFHLLRHYGRGYELDPDDPDRVHRLAAYAKCPVSETKWLRVGSFAQYAVRDGPAFAYVTSFNPHIWRDQTASNAIRDGKFPRPEDTEFIIRNRAACVAESGTPEHSTVQPAAESPALATARIHKSIEGMTEMLDVVRQEVISRIGWLQRLAVLALVVLVVIVLFTR